MTRSCILRRSKSLLVFFILLTLSVKVLKTSITSIDPSCLVWLRFDRMVHFKKDVSRTSKSPRLEADMKNTYIKKLKTSVKDRIWSVIMKLEGSTTFHICLYFETGDFSF